MGARATRITREELLTPPEFQGLHPKEHQAARVGGARIELVRCGVETRLGACYQQVPVRLMPPFVIDGESASLLYLINLTAGLMDGDGHLIEIKARAGTRALVTGQSATRVHPALASYATQQWAVEAEDDACLVVLPGPAIPFQGSRYYQRARVELAPSPRLIWGDIWFAGRYNRGALSERFQFERIVQDFEARRAGRLIYRDRFRWDGPWNSEEVDWYFGGTLASASLFISGPTPEVLPEAEAGPAFRRSIFRLDTGDICMRWSGNPTAVTADLAVQALRLAGAWTGGPEAAPWFLDSTGLAPNHWFSTPVVSE
ncbi:urease accessory protein UreD [Singulisphaera acidiphila]|uniref:urease accessory protein UreD n=1 Tax=Singulisphaera acidiphila TaxID=466153 RepID=UPI000474C853|nr:urease accessory protein UreD [Singulisphaera acidiphila]